jgi:hypothetical protein
MLRYLKMGEVNKILLKKHSKTYTSTPPTTIGGVK